MAADTDQTRGKARPFRRLLGRIRKRLRAFRSRVRRHRSLDLTWRAGIFVLGTLIVIAGLIMFITPGPGWLALILGLAILATEFSWAERALHWARVKAAQAAHKALDPRTRNRNLLIAAAVVVVVAGCSVLWVSAYGLPAPVARMWNWMRGLP
ncbi:TIGR02611 family protein [Flindersiella endophytica]